MRLAKDHFGNSRAVSALYRLVREDSGATSIEYAVIAAGVGAAVAAVVLSLGNPIAPKYQAASDGFDALGAK